MIEFFTLAGIGLHLMAVASMLLYERRQPTATMAWILALVFLPFVGLALYFVIGRPVARRVAGRYAEVVARIDAVLERRGVRKKIKGQSKEVEPRTASLLALTERLASTPASHGNRADALIDGAETYTAIAKAIQSARHHVHVEFYIIQPDEAGKRLRELLTERAAQGVEVRILCDGVGSGNLPGDFWAPLEAAGGHAAWFRPAGKIITRLPFRDRIDFRNHRKLVIVDGEVGFTGGINVGREYLGLDPEMGNWRDTHVQIRGPAVLGLQKVFAEDWLHATEEMLDTDAYFPELEAAGKDEIQIVDSGPDRDWSPIEKAVVHAIALSKERVWITSPYFVPPAPVESALTSAALRGVDVRLLLPLKPDQRIVATAAASYFQSMLDSGVRIFRYERGFVHAKTLLVDSWVGSIGSANMDMRSFHLNYELNAFVFGERFTTEMAEQFERDLEHTQELFEVPGGLFRRLVRGAARLLSPLL